MSVTVLLNDYSDTFEGLGCLPNKVHLDVDTSVTPKICPVYVEFHTCYNQN